MSFPFHNAHREASCFRCAGQLRDLSPTGNAPGAGHYRGFCPKCRVFTWYDCAEGSVELIEQNERTAPQKNPSPIADAMQSMLDRWYAGELARGEIESFIRYGNLSDEEKRTLGLVTST